MRILAPCLMMLLASGCATSGPGKASVRAICTIWLGTIPVTQPDDRRALREAELLARAQWNEACGGE